MIQVRVICDVNDVPFVVADLCRLWHVHAAKEYPAKDSGQRHLYLAVTRRPTNAK
ncbi:hypothetical protein ABTZ03_37205 [Kitasatospora sp. NPDC096077]|uniref:hypothetical protein n=1 Tax=Kitasatospora sp. NPDC096077 TaxID=3155544 RepID=UPI003316791A